MTADGSGPGDGLDAGEGDAPMTEAEAAAGAAAAGADADESLDERIGTVVEELDGVTRIRDGGAEHLAVGGRVFAVVGAELLEVALAGRVARAALATPDTRPSTRGAGWVAFAPPVSDRFALDRAEAWVRYAYRRAAAPR